MEWFAGRYSKLQVSRSEFETDIKWSRNLKRRFDSGQVPAASSIIRPVMYRPFVANFLYDSELFIDELGLSRSFFPTACANSVISAEFTKDFRVLVSGIPYDLHFLGDAQGVALYAYDESGNRHDNVTDWGLKQFRDHYEKRAPSPQPLYVLVRSVFLKNI